MRYITRLFATIFILSGILILISPLSSKITGFAIAENTISKEQSLAGIWLIASGWSILLIKKEKKAQASTEFLMTYGWAILAAIVAIGVLTYFGVFTNIKDSNKRISLSPPFIAQAEEWNPVTQEYSLLLQNGGAISYTISKLTISKNGVNTCQQNFNEIIEPGFTKDLILPCQGLQLNNIATKLQIEYTWYGSNIVQISEGEIGLSPQEQVQESGQGQSSGPACGNGIIEAGEQCDDGSVEFGDGCDDTCLVEVGWTCSGEPSLCEPDIPECNDQTDNDSDGLCDLAGCLIQGNIFAEGDFECTDLNDNSEAV